MNLNRRKFIKTILVGSAAAVVAPKVLLAVKKPMITEPIVPAYNIAIGNYDTVSWKTYYSSVILNENWMRRVTC